MAKKRTPARHIRDEERKHHPTPGDILGPFYRKGVPFMHSGIAAARARRDLVHRGQVSSETGGPLAGALIEIWQAAADAHRDNDDPTHQPPRRWMGAALTRT